MIKSIFIYSRYVVIGCLIVAAAVIGCLIYTSYGVQIAPISQRNTVGLEQVDDLLDQREKNINRHKESIDSAEMVISTRKNLKPEDKYWLYKTLYLKAHLLSFSYSMRYAEYMCKLADLMHDKGRKAEAEVYRAYSMCRGGFFKEAIDAFERIKVEATLPDSVLASYYIYGGRTWHDLADYANYDSLSQHYKQVGNEWLKKALPYITSTVDYYYVKGKMLLWNDRLKEARPYYMKALKACSKNDVERLSIMNSTLACIDMKLGNMESATHYYIVSVLNDVGNGIVETVAIRSLASILFDHYHDAFRSSKYLIAALNNAQYFGTRYRINSMGALLPVFVEQREEIEQEHKTVMKWGIAIMSALVVLLIILLIQNLKYSRQQYASKKELERMNARLDEANKIKNQYIGHYVNVVSVAAVDIERFAMLAEQKIAMGQAGAILPLITKLHESYNKKKVREDFDSAFLLIFPSFIEDFNDLLDAYGQQHIEKKGYLTPVLRIFGLIRLGVTDNDEIARVLDYSFNTIYNYRIRTRNRAKRPETFEWDVAQIGL